MDPERSQAVSIALKPGSTGDSGIMDDAHLRWCHGRADPSSESRFCCAAKADMLLRDELHTVLCQKNQTPGIALLRSLGDIG